MRHHFCRPQAMFNKGSLFYSHCGSYNTRTTQLEKCGAKWGTRAFIYLKEKSLTNFQVRNMQLLMGLNNGSLDWITCLYIHWHFLNGVMNFRAARTKFMNSYATTGCLNCVNCVSPFRFIILVVFNYVPATLGCSS
jgi:hypothetical protein